MKNNLFIVNGASGSGKNVLVKAMMEDKTLPFAVKRVVTDTDRAPRAGEVDGVDYYFRTTDDFLKRVENGEYLEHSLYAGKHKGLRKASLDSCMNEKNTIIILIMDKNGVNFMKSLYPNAKSVYIDTPYETLEERMRNRNDSEEAIRERLEFYKSSNESENKYKSDTFLVNDSTLENLKDKFVEYILSVNS